MCEPNSKHPMMRGPRFEQICSTGWQYAATSATSHRTSVRAPPEALDQAEGIAHRCRVLVVLLVNLLVQPLALVEQAVAVVE